MKFHFMCVQVRVCAYMNAFAYMRVRLCMCVLPRGGDVRVRTRNVRIHTKNQKELWHRSAALWHDGKKKSAPLGTP